MGSRLHLKLFLVTAVALGAALWAASLFTQQAARTEFHRVELLQGAERLQGAAAVLALRLAGAETSGNLNPVLEDLARSQRREMILVSPEGAVLGASTPELRAARVTRGASGDIELTQTVRKGNVMARMRTVLAGGPQAVVRRADGSVLGTLVLLPATLNMDPPGRAAFGIEFDRRLLLAAGAAGLIALALTWMLSRRLLHPVTALTRAAGLLGRGDLSQRVEVRSSDELGQLSSAFNSMAQSLSRQETLRRTLVTDVAHELRTPLTNLRCQLEAVEDGLVPATQESFRSLREEVLLLARLVEDLETLSIAEAGRLGLDRAPVLLRELAEGALDSVRAQAGGRGVTLSNCVPEHECASADAGRIGQVLRNLLANALRHTPAGGTIEVSARPEPQGTLVTLRVRDTGPGIPPEHLPHVFERFYRADPSRARATGGAGLGLAIVKGIVEAHGGAVGVESTPGHGATFCISLPRP